MPEIYDAPRPWTGEIKTPLTLFETTVRPAWIDEYGHVNIAHYLTIADHSNWAFWNWINAPNGAIEARGGHEYVIVENHVHYLGELMADDPIRTETRLLAHDDKRFILFHEIYKQGEDTPAATNEAKFLSFDLNARRPSRWTETPAARLSEIAAAHAALEAPAQAGLGIALKRR